MKCVTLIFLLLLQTFGGSPSEEPHTKNNPVKIAVVGLTHDHVHWLFGRDNNRNDIEIVGIYEPDEELWLRYKEMYDLNQSLHFDDLAEIFSLVKYSSEG